MALFAQNLHKQAFSTKTNTKHFGVIMVLYTQTKTTKILSIDFETKTQGPFCTILSHLPQF